MAGYANRKIRIDFPELSEPGDDVHVIIRNPKTMPEEDVRLEEKEGQTEEEKQEAIRKRIASLIIAWHVYDAKDTGDDQARLPLPATAELVRRLPTDITLKIATTFAEAMGVQVEVPQPAES